VNDGPRGLELLSLVHRNPGISRADAARELGMGSGQATEITARLVADRLIGEGPSAPSGARGRPSTVLGPHPDGPLAVVAAIAHDGWRVAIVELGERVLEQRAGEHDQTVAGTLSDVAAAIATLRRGHRTRVRATAVSVPGTVAGDVVLQAPGLGWSDVSLTPLRPSRSNAPFVAGNDATFAAIGEARRGTGIGYRSMLHLYFDAGVGGAIVEDGRAVVGATGVAGEFGHLPFADPALRCPCGARGCWNLAIDAASIAHRLGRRRPRSQAGFVGTVLAAARGGDAASAAAVAEVAREVGRGTAGLVNALDPAIVTFGGWGGGLLGPDLDAAYRVGLMSSRRRNAPALVAGALGGEAPLIGAAEEAFDRILTSAGLAAWSAR
jgi:predicted NBD/HSP70 family sugar kinase